MSSRWNLGFVAPVMMGATLALGGCVDNDISLSINDFVAPDVSLAASNECDYDATSLPLQRGTYDARLGSVLGVGYFANFSMENNLPEVMNAPIETQAYYVQSFDVILETSGLAGGAIPPMNRRLSYPVASTRIAPGDTTFFSVQAIPASQSGAFLDLIQAAAQKNESTTAAVTIHLRPVSTRAEEQQTGAYSSFPIDVCDGCLTGTGAAALPMCTALKGQTPLVGNVCNFASDVPVTCCTDDTTKATICGSQVMNHTGT